MKLRKTALAMLFMALITACGNDPTGDVETGTGGNVKTTGGSAYN
jgi:hypothetical protein